MEQTKPHAKKALAFLAIIVSLLAACLLAGCSSSNSQEKVELEIYAANSLTDAMDEAQGSRHQRQSERNLQRFAV